MKRIIVFLFILGSFSVLAQNNGVENNQLNNSNFIEENSEKESSNERLVPEPVKSPGTKKAQTSSKKLREENTSKKGKSSTVHKDQKVVTRQSLKQEYDVLRKRSNSSSSRSINVTAQKKLNTIVNKLENNKANSFEYHTLKYVNGNHNTQLFNHLQSAYKMNPKDKEVLKLMTAYYEITDNESQKKSFATLLKEENPYSNDTYEYLKNVLNSVPHNGVLLTYGSLDTYPLFILNSVEKYRRDVKVVSLDLMQSETYRSKLGAQGFNIPKSTIIDLDFFKLFCQLNEHKDLNLSLTIPKDYFYSIQSKIYATGLAFKYSNEKINNIQHLKNSWNKFEKNIFEKSKNPSNESSQLLSNYLVPLIVLKKYYLKQKDYAKAEELGAYIQKISTWKNKSKQVEKILTN